MLGLAFFNPYLLWGLGGASIPILIHLFNRRRFRTVAWGAMEFLVSSSKMTARRLKIVQALLLLTRMGIVSLLVLGLARPFLTGVFFGGSLARSKSSAVIIVDNSYSMGLREGNETNFDVAKQVAGNLASSFRRGDSLTYIVMAARPRVVTEGNPSPGKVRKLIGRSELSDERTDILGGLLTGLEILDSEKNTRKELFLITDCQRNGWGVGNSGGWDKLNQLLLDAKVQPRVYVVDVSRQAGENITVNSIKLPMYPCGVGKRYVVEVNATSSAEKPAGRPVFTLFLDDEKREIRTAEGSDFEDGVSRGRLVFSVDEPGAHWGKIEVQADCLEADNARYFNVEARRSIPILCIDGVEAEDRFESGIAYLAYAFAPDKGMGMEETPGMSNILDPKVAGISQFWEENLGQYEIVVLSNVRAISGRMAEALGDFVGNGGGLLIFLGDSVDPVDYSERYLSSAKSFLPCAISSAKGELPREGGNEPAQDAYRISELDFGHPAMAGFRDGAGGDLSTAKFYRFFSVKPDSADADVSVLARFDDGWPYIVEKRFGRGKTILFTSSSDLKWSNLPLKPVFLPLIHRLAYYVTSGADERYSLTVGEKIAQRVEGGAASAPVTVTAPDGLTVKVVARGGGEEEGNGESEAFVSFEETSRAGMYTMRAPKDSAEEPGEGHAEGVSYFAVNVDTEESDLSPLEGRAIERLIRSNECRYLRAEEGIVERIGQIRQGKEVWRFLVVAVLCFLVVESVLARQIDKG